MSHKQRKQEVNHPILDPKRVEEETVRYKGIKMHIARALGVPYEIFCYRVRLHPEMHRAYASGCLRVGHKPPPPLVEKPSGTISFRDLHCRKQEREKIIAVVNDYDELSVKRWEEKYGKDVTLVEAIRNLPWQ